MKLRMPDDVVYRPRTPEARLEALLEERARLLKEKARLECGVARARRALVAIGYRKPV
jgi:hypothetical protein